jgi:hypothetical protein
MMDDSYSRIIEIERSIRDSLSTTLKINHEQVEELVVADLLGKYRAHLKRKDNEWADIIKAMLRFYLEQHELDLLLSHE